MALIQSGKDANLYIGVMSGTSADGIDLALVDFQPNNSQLIANDFTPYSNELHQAITGLYLPGKNEIDRAYALDVLLAREFAQAINRFLSKLTLTPKQIKAIGNHGQTIRHRPLSSQAFTVQITCNQTLAALTGIRVIGDFRTKDMVYGGQGAPLVPAFHQYLFAQLAAKVKDIVVVNIGGIANISYLPQGSNNNAAPHDNSQEKAVLGFDTGPGNCLMDAWYQQHQTGHYDKNGQWAATGVCHQALLAELLSDQYFCAKAPKSTGREYFHLDWLNQHITNLGTEKIASQDVQATLLTLTAISISQEITSLTEHAAIYLCGGGTLNSVLVDAITKQLTNNSPSTHYDISTIDSLGINNDAFEAMAFAWFAYAFDQKIIGNVPSVTGAKKALVLGVEFNL